MGKKYEFAKKPIKLCLIGAIDEGREISIHYLLETLDRQEKPTGEYVEVEMRIQLELMRRVSSKSIVFEGFNVSGNAVRITFANGKEYLNVYGD